MLHRRFMQSSGAFAQSPKRQYRTFLGTGYGVQGLRAHPLPFISVSRARASLMAEAAECRRTPKTFVQVLSAEAVSAFALLSFCARASAWLASPHWNL